MVTQLQQGAALGQMATNNTLRWVPPPDATEPVVSMEASVVALNKAYERVRDRRNVVARVEREVANAVAYRDKMQAELDAAIAIYDEALAALLYPKPKQHLSDCATHNEPAMPAGPCDCSTAA
jgi:hypothetical protein